MTHVVQVEPTKAEMQLAGYCGLALARWFPKRGRQFPWRSWRDLYRVLVVEALLQRTRAAVVAAFAPAFFDAYPDWHALSAAPQSDLEAQLFPLGLSRLRARRLKAVAREMVGGQAITRLEDLPGVGQYVARAIRVTIRASAEAMVDANFVRVLRRVFGEPWMSDYRYDRRLQALAMALVLAAPDSRTANWAVLDLGALICTPRSPKCRECPLAEVCLAARQRESQEGVIHPGST